MAVSKARLWSFKPSEFKSGENAKENGETDTRRMMIQRRDERGSGILGDDFHFQAVVRIGHVLGNGTKATVYNFVRGSPK